MTIFGKKNHRSHPHTLQLEYVKDAYVCNSCKEVCFGKRYSCSDKGCDFHMHVACVDPPHHTRHHLLKNQVFIFQDSKDENRNYYCDACGQDINDSSYRSIASHNIYGWIDLHPCCVLTLETKISNIHVNVILQKEISSGCYLCGLKELSNGRVSWGYVCQDDKELYQFHLFCVKKKLMDYLENITLGIDLDGLNPIENSDIGHGESSALVLTRINPNESRINGWNHDQKKKGIIQTTLKFVFSLIVSVLLGNPSAMIVDLASSLLSN